MLPNVEHRFCVMHLHDNFKTTGYRFKAYKDLLYETSTSSNVPYFEATMGKMKETDDAEFKWFNDKPPQHWFRSHFNIVTNVTCCLTTFVKCSTSVFLM